MCAPESLTWTTFLTRDTENQQKYGEMGKALEEMNPEYQVEVDNVVFDVVACYSKQFYTKIKNV